MGSFVEKVKSLTIGSPDKDLAALMGPVIHRCSFEKIRAVIDESNKDPTLKCLVGGAYDDSQGYFVKPTVYLADSPEHKLFNGEIFGPVLTVHVYPGAEYSNIMESIDRKGGGLALTGAVFARSQPAIREAEDTL